MAAITAAAIGTAGTIYATKKSADAQKKAASVAAQGTEAADPQKQYRPEYAKQLNDLMKDPSSIANTAEYKARQQAVARQLAAQGYTGSGNALIEAADAAGQSYQQAFNNLNALAGGTPGGGYDTAANVAQAGADQTTANYAGIANNVANLGATIGGKFNTPSAASTAVGPVTKQAIPLPQANVKVGGM